MTRWIVLALLMGCSPMPDKTINAPGPGDESPTPRSAPPTSTPWPVTPTIWPNPPIEGECPFTPVPIPMSEQLAHTSQGG